MAITFTSQDTMKVCLNWQVGAVCFAVNVFEAVMSQSSPHPVSSTVVEQDVETWMEAVLSPIEPDVVVDCTILGADFYKLVAGDWVYAGTGMPSFTPASIGDPLPSGVAALLSLTTEQSKVRGRKYLPGLSELAQTAGEWTLTVLGHLADCILGWFTPFVSADPSASYWLPCVVNKYGVPVPFNGGLAVSVVPAYQRRRRAGVGS